MNTHQPFYSSVDLPESAVETYNQLFFLKNFFQEPGLFDDRIKEVEKRTKNELPAIENDIGEIECYSADELPLDRFQELWQEDIRPIVIRGFAKDFDSVRYWSPEYFLEKYAAFKVWYSSTEELVVEDGTLLGDYIQEIIGGNISRAYVENLSDIFNAYPELHEQAGINRIDEYLGDFASYHRIAQLFIGGLGSGAVFHCANELNCFVNIYGQKKWTFVHPKYSAAMYSSLFNNGIFVGSFVKHKAPKGFIEANYPLYNRIPKLTITLEPGDLLINPPWWWHAVNNVTPISIAMATRWEILVENHRQNPLYDFVQSLRKEKLTLEGKKLSKTDIVVPDSEIRKKYVSYEQMGWKA